MSNQGGFVMRIIRSAVLVTLWIAGVAVPAHAMNWSLGANLGYTSYNPDEGETVSIFAWPSTTQFVTPGLRIGFMGDNPIHEFHLDTGLVLVSSDGASSSIVTFTGNY